LSDPPARRPLPARETPLTLRFLGVPWLFAVAYSAVAFSIYFALGIVADRGLGLTPLIMLGAGLVFALTTLTYVEGGAMFVERGGSTSLARHAFNELVSFIAGWAILIDYILVIAMAAITVPHYLRPISDDLTHGTPEIAIAVLVVGFAASVNIAGFTGERRQGLLVLLAVADLVVQLAVIAVGLAVALDPGALTAQLDIGTAPSFEDIVFAGVVALVALAGLEAASNLAPDLNWEDRDLPRVVVVGGAIVPLVYVGMASVALMAVPVVATPSGPETALAGPYLDSPVLGVVLSYSPAWLADVLKWPVALVAPAVLTFAATTTMLGLSRHAYTLATNRQIPSWLGKLGAQRSTPHVAIAIAAAIAIGLLAGGDLEFLASAFAFGATIAIAIAHLAVIRLRVSDPERARPFRIPLNVRFRGGSSLPVPAIAGALLMVGAWISVVALRGEAVIVGAVWMAVGIVGYVVYRTVVQGTSLTRRVTVPEEALFKLRPDVEYGSILVPVFGSPLDDDIVGTAGRLADAAEVPGDRPPRIELIYVMDLPLTVPLDAPPPPQRVEAARRALERAREVGEEYETCEIATEIVPARSVGAGIVDEARRLKVELIVMGGEPPSPIRGGAGLGGIGAARPAEVGEVTEYVLRKAPCRVLLTAPPAD
jgi:APA family basic amino acid/polyamine antiporter